jgi:hypothetical protein
LLLLSVVSGKAIKDSFRQREKRECARRINHIGGGLGITSNKISMTLQEFARKRKELFWSVKDPGKLSTEAIVEGILNYGNWDDVQTLFKILGIKKVSRIFRKQTSGWRTNYRPKIKNYFKLYFDKYA